MLNRGLLIRNASVIEANGTYYLQDSNVSLMDMVWVSADKVTRICCKNQMYFYTLTTDATVGHKNYYVKNEAGDYQEVTDPVLNSQIYAGTYYERTVGSAWIIQRMSVGPTGETIEGETLFVAPVEVDTPPYSAVWYNTLGVSEPLSITPWDESSIIATTETSEPDENGTVTTVTTITNVITGDVRKETSIVYKKTVYTREEITRYENVNLVLGKVYRFQFVSDFAQLGYDPTLDDTTQPITAGIFRVDKIMSYMDLVASGIDLYTNLYSPCRIPKDVYLGDVPKISDTTIYRLVDPTDESRVFFMPQTFIKDTPDASVEECSKVLLTIDLGIHGKEKVGTSLLIDDMKDFLSQILEKRWGIGDASDKTYPTVDQIEYDKVWLTESQRVVLEAAREQKSKDSTVNFAELFNLDKTNIHYKENLRLKGKIRALEEKLIEQSNKLKTLKTNE